jgi:diketogulonate reductase-like aldo/keto reductase
MGNKMQDETLLDLGKKHGKSPAQLLIRYSIQKGWVPLPSSQNQSRMKENADVFDFEISREDMNSLDSLESSDPNADRGIHASGL